MGKFKLILFYLLYILNLSVLTVYSYSQIDLNLTLSQNSGYQTFQKTLLQLGYYYRTWSAGIFIVLIIGLFIHYGVMLYLTSKRTIHMSHVLLIIVITIVALLFSYPAFSYDIFNYIFDARILVKYGQNPYFHKALDFPGDDWIRFMRWTHRSYPYGPVWLLVTSLVYALGFGHFILTLFNFKLFFAGLYALCMILIYKIAVILKLRNPLIPLVFVALNPLVIIESLVSPHNEWLMILGLLYALLALFQQRKFLSLLSLGLSGGVKYITWILLPIFTLIPGKNGKNEKTLELTFFAISLILLPVILFRESYPWYFVTLVCLAPFTRFKVLKYSIIALTAGEILRYMPFILIGEYSATVSLWQNVLTAIPILPICLVYFLKFFHYGKKDAKINL